jgi:hypothetical protein
MRGTSFLYSWRFELVLLAVNSCESVCNTEYEMWFSRSMLVGQCAAQMRDSPEIARDVGEAFRLERLNPIARLEGSA